VVERWQPFTLPNLVTLIRLAFIPVYVWVLFGLDDRYAAAILLGSLGATDWVDGFLARRLDQVSELGKILDPVTDRLLLVTAIVTILIDGSMPLWVALLVLAREVLISIAGVVLAALGAVRIDVTFVGKTGTFFNMFAFPAFLVAESDASWAGLARVIAWVCVALGLGFGWYALYDYVPRGRQALAEGRAGQAET
jgi:cardiolipin synthase